MQQIQASRKCFCARSRIKTGYSNSAYNSSFETTTHESSNLQPSPAGSSARPLPSPLNQFRIKPLKLGKIIPASHNQPLTHSTPNIRGVPTYTSSAMHTKPSLHQKPIRLVNSVASLPATLSTPACRNYRPGDQPLKPIEVPPHSHWMHPSFPSIGSRPLARLQHEDVVLIYSLVSHAMYSTYLPPGTLYSDPD